MATVKDYQKDLNKDLSDFLTELQTKFPDVVVTSGFRPRAFTKQGNVSRHAKREAVDIRPTKELQEFLWNTKEGISMLNKYGLGLLDETDPETLKKTGGTGAHFHIGKDSTLVPKAQQRYKELWGEQEENVVKDTQPIVEQTTNVTNLPIEEKITTFVEKPEEKLFLQDYQNIFKPVENIPQFVEEQPTYNQPTESVTDIFNKVSQFIDSPLAQQGGNIGNLTQDQIIDVEKQREWLNNWNKNRVIEGEKINSNIEVPFSEDIYIDDLNYSSIGGSKTLGEFDSVTNRILFDENYTNKKGVPSHEFSHRFQKDFKTQNPQDYNKFVSEPINKYLKKAGGFTAYQLDPDETHSEINRLRYNQGYQPGQVIKSEDLSETDLKNYNFKQFSKEEILDILNSTAGLQDKNQNSYAQQGGDFSENELAFLKEFKNIPVSSKGMYEYPNQTVLVPTNGSITMKGIPHKIKATSLETGEEKILHPEKEYFFKNTKTVLEKPL